MRFDLRADFIVRLSVNYELWDSRNILIVQESIFEKKKNNSNALGRNVHNRLAN